MPEPELSHLNSVSLATLIYVDIRYRTLHCFIVLFYVKCLLPHMTQSTQKVQTMPCFVTLWFCLHYFEHSRLFSCIHRHLQGSGVFMQGEEATVDMCTSMFSCLSLFPQHLALHFMHTRSWVNDQWNNQVLLAFIPTYQQYHFQEWHPFQEETRRSIILVLHISWICL